MSRRPQSLSLIRCPSTYRLRHQCPEGTNNNPRDSGFGRKLCDRPEIKIMKLPKLAVHNLICLFKIESLYSLFIKVHGFMGAFEKERQLPVAVHSMSKLQHQQPVEQMQQQKPQTEKRLEIALVTI